MDVAYINPFIVGALEVLKKMARVEAVAGKPFVSKTDVAHGDVSGIIGITGDAVGSLAISFTNGCICAVVGRMLGEVYTEPTRDVLDAVGEITNMISGVARTRMEKEGLNVYAAIPSVVFGSNHTINHILKSPSIVVPFSAVGGTFFHRRLHQEDEGTRERENGLRGAERPYPGGGTYSDPAVCRSSGTAGDGTGAPLDEGGKTRTDEEDPRRPHRQAGRHAAATDGQALPRSREEEALQKEHPPLRRPDQEAETRYLRFGDAGKDKSRRPGKTEARHPLSALYKKRTQVK